jgi:hypothetical protein
MNLIQLRFNAAEIRNVRLLTALQAGFSAYRHLHSKYDVRLAWEDGWFLDVFVGGTPFAVDHELITATLLRQGIPFDISMSPLGVEGEPVDIMYGLRRTCDVSVVWHDHAQTVGGGCSTEELDATALELLGVNIQIERIGSVTYLYASEYLDGLADKSTAFISTLALSPTADPVLRESARYLVRPGFQSKIA